MSDTCADVAITKPEKPCVQLTDEQEAVLDGLNARINAGFPYSVLNGLAGTGKTTLVSRYAADNPGTSVVTYTGKASSVLRKKGVSDASTIHGMFYKLVSSIEVKNKPPVLRFKKAFGPGSLKNHTVVIDECSMVDGPMAADILETGCHIVACGDPGQLPPVFGQRFFGAADFTLQHIHRQALESPIIRQAHAVRLGNPYGADGDGFRVARRATDRDLTDAEVVLVWSNKTRQNINQRMRRIAGRTGCPRAGEPVLCLQNSREFGIYNGVIYRLGADFMSTAPEISLVVEGRIVIVPYVQFENELEPEPQRDNKGRPRRFTSKFDYGYCLTVHKSQGSEWPSVLLFDEYQRRDQRKEWLYTAITRASERILTIQGAFAG